MRAGLLEQLPALTLEFGILPPDIDYFTADEIDWYVKVAARRMRERADTQKKLDEQTRKLRRRRR